MRQAKKKEGKENDELLSCSPIVLLMSKFVLPQGRFFKYIIFVGDGNVFVPELKYGRCTWK